MSESQTSGAVDGVRSARLNPKWLVKIGLFTLLLLTFGVWGAVDAAWLYPRRGLADASFQLKNWLTALDAAGRLSSANVSIAEPRAAFAELRGRQVEIENAARASDSPSGRVAKAELAKLAYLESLSKTWRLNADDKPLASIVKPSPRSLFFQPVKGEGYAVGQGNERTTLSPAAMLKELTEYWNVTKPATPLSGFDMLFQYVFIVAGFGGGLYLVASILKARGRAGVIRWDPSRSTLELGSGVSISPANFADLDKRLWHKYYADVLTTDGKSHRVDLLRYVPLEEWVLELERIKFPERAAEEAAKKAAADAQQAGAPGDQQGGESARVES